MKKVTSYHKKINLKQSLITLPILLLGFVMANLYADDYPQKTIFELMTNYEKFFSTYVVVTGIKAEMVDDEFILEAEASEEQVLNSSYNPKKLEVKDLFINIRIDEREIRAKIEKLKPGTRIELLLEVRESTVYNKIIPVFAVHDFQALGRGTPIAHNQNNDKKSSSTNATSASRIKFGRRIKLKRK